MREGPFPLVALTGAVAAAVVWGVSAHDPYWRLFETRDIAAPTYESPQDLQAALEAALPVGNADMGAVSPPVAPADGSLEPIPPDDTVPAIVARAGVAADEQWVMAAFQSTSDGPGEVAAVPLTAPVALRRPETADIVDVLAIDTLAPFAAPEAPEQPRVAADEETEDALALDRSERIDVQRRLALAGFDPKGFDGVFGPRTQRARRFPDRMELPGNRIPRRSGPGRP